MVWSFKEVGPWLWLVVVVSWTVVMLVVVARLMLSVSVS